MPTSEVAPSPLVSRVTPRSSPQKWGSPIKGRYKKGTQLPTSPSSSFRPSGSTGKKAIHIPKASPKSLIQRLSDSPLVGTAGSIITPPSGPPESPKRLLEKLMKSEVLSTMLSNGSNAAMLVDTSVVQEPTTDNMVRSMSFYTSTRLVLFSYDYKRSRMVL